MPIIINRHRWLALAVILTLSVAALAGGQGTAGTVEERLQKLETENKDLRRLLDSLRQELEKLRGTSAAPAPATARDTVDIEELLEPPAGTEQTVTNLGDPGMDTASNPFISFSFDFATNMGDRQPALYDVDGRNRKRILGLRSLEMTAQRGVSAYADAFVVYGDHGHGFELEEGYLDISRLIPQTNIRLGKWRTAFGPYNPVHEHQMPFVSYPRSLTNFFGDHGVIGEGVEVAYQPRTRDYLQLRGGLYRKLGAGTPVFAADQQERLSTSAQVRYNRQLSDLTDLDLRVGYLNAPNEDAAGSRTEMFSSAVQWRRDQGNLRSDRVVLEWIGMDRETGVGNVRRNAVSALYLKQLGQYHDWGVLYDNAQFGDPGLLGRTQHYSAFYTWKAQETQWFRALYRHGRYPTGSDTNELVLQSIWSIGPHSHEFN